MIRVKDYGMNISKTISNIKNEYFRKKIEIIAACLLLPDEKAFWGLAAIRDKDLQRQEFDLIYATAFPWTSLLLGVYLRRRLGRPLVVDFRDSWTLNPGNRLWNSNPFLSYLESVVIRAADSIICATEGMREDYQHVYPDHCCKFITIRNGFDPQILECEYYPEKTNKKTIITYTGSLADLSIRIENDQTIFYIIKAITNLKKELLQKLEVNVYSNPIPNTQKYIESLGLAGVIKLKERVSYREAIQIRRKSDVLLLVVKNVPAAKQIATGKLYEYIADRKMILAIAPDISEASRIVQHYQLGICVDPKNIQELTRVLTSIILHGPFVARESSDRAIADFNGQLLVAKFKDVFNSLCMEK
ncbi:MAG: glycosyltransferase [Candidatus Desulforudaceae bacterium]